MEISYFDIVVGAVILLLGLKGILNGFFKELFGLIGIIGGVFVASRVGNDVGQAISNTLLHIESKTAINFTGFLITLAFFWLAMIAVGYVFKKLSKMSGLGPVDKIMGFVVGAGKFFLIVAIVAYALYNINIVRTNMQETMNKSILFPILVETGGYIMKIDTVALSKDINETVAKKQEDLNDKVVKEISEEIKKNEQNLTHEIKEKVKEFMPKEKQDKVN